MSDQVEEVKQKTDIVQIVSEHVDLKKAGRNFKGLCPFHTEKTPSFMVSPELQIFKCFGCSESGDAFTFLQKQEGMDFPEALKFLADRAGVKLKLVGGKRSSDREKMHKTALEISKFYHYVLLKHEKGKKALAYLKKERGLKEGLIKEFKIGFAPEGSTGTAAYFLSRKKRKPEDFVKVGVLLKGRGGHFDRFGGRIIFPLFDHRGNTIGFAGRLLPGDKRDLAKYINSPDTSVYHKSEVLYGLDKTRSFIKEKGEVIVVEGELDLISSWEAGIKNVVATKGTALTQEQVKLLSRFTEKIVLALDTDFAGNEAALRGITIAQNEGLEVLVAKLGKFKDPDEAARKDPSFYKKAIKDAIDVWEFVIEFLTKKHDVSKAMGKAKANKEVVSYLVKIDNKIVQSHYIKLLADKLSVPEESVIEEMKKATEPYKKRSIKKVGVKMTEKKTGREIKEERLMFLLFQDADKIGKSELKVIKTSSLKKVLEEYKKYTKTNKKADLEGFSRHLPNELKQIFFEVAFGSSQEYLPDHGGIKKEKKAIILSLEILEIDEKQEALTKKMKEKEQKGESTNTLSKKYSELGVERYNLKKAQEEV